MNNCGKWVWQRCMFKLNRLCDVTDYFLLMIASDIDENLRKKRNREWQILLIYSYTYSYAHRLWSHKRRFTQQFLVCKYIATSHGFNFESPFRHSFIMPTIEARLWKAPIVRESNLCFCCYLEILIIHWVFVLIKTRPFNIWLWTQKIWALFLVKLQAIKNKNNAIKYIVIQHVKISSLNHKIT